MGSQRPTFTYGRYYYGEEAVSGNDVNNIRKYNENELMIRCLKHLPSVHSRILS